MAGNSADSGRSVTSKVVAIVKTFASGPEHSLTEIARMTGLPVSTAHRLATELAAWGVLERAADGRYRMGLRLQALAGAAGDGVGLHGRAPRVMEDLAAAARTRVRLGVLDDLDVAYIEKPVGHRAVSAFSDAALLPAHATALGKALLAFAPSGTVERVIARGLKRYTPATLAAPDQLRRALRQTRLSGVAVCCGELCIGGCAVAMPVFGAAGHLVAALELEVNDPREDLPLVQPVLLVAARSLSRELLTAASPVPTEHGHLPALVLA